MRRICVFFGEMSKEYQRYMFLKQFESLKISSRFHSNFKEYFVFKMKSRDFAFGRFQRAPSMYKCQEETFTLRMNAIANEFQKVRIQYR